MALTGTSRGEGSIDNPYEFSPASNFSAGTMAVLVLAYNNAGAFGADPFTSVTDSNGNTWTTRQSYLRDPGSGSEGCVLRILTSMQNGGTLTTGSVITLNASPEVDRAAWTLSEVSSSTGTPFYVTGGTTSASGTTATITSSSITNTNMIFGGFAAEDEAAITADSDTTNGSWSTQQTAVNTTAGTGASAMRVCSQRKIVNADGAQTYNLSWSGSTNDAAIGWIEISDISETLFDPFGTLGIFGI